MLIDAEIAFLNCGVPLVRAGCLLYPVLSSEPLSYLPSTDRKYCVWASVPLTLASVSYAAWPLPYSALWKSCGPWYVASIFDFATPSDAPQASALASVGKVWRG